MLPGTVIPLDLAPWWRALDCISPKITFTKHTDQVNLRYWMILAQGDQRGRYLCWHACDVCATSAPTAKDQVLLDCTTEFLCSWSLNAAIFQCNWKHMKASLPAPKTPSEAPFQILSTCLYNHIYILIFELFWYILIHLAKPRTWMPCMRSKIYALKTLHYPTIW